MTTRRHSQQLKAYHVEDRWENYDKIKEVIQKRYIDVVNQR
ncbi:hypothetical protein QF033_000838 [Bacillus pumilus]|nr:hypothetical protein [Bacillus pumilus]MDQ0816260.1 hypothetical protein [Bacillus pumilus]